MLVDGIIDHVMLCSGWLGRMMIVMMKGPISMMYRIPALPLRYSGSL